MSTGVWGSSEGRHRLVGRPRCFLAGATARGQGSSSAPVLQLAFSGDTLMIILWSSGLWRRDNRLGSVDSPVKSSTRRSEEVRNSWSDPFQPSDTQPRRRLEACAGSYGMSEQMPVSLRPMSLQDVVNESVVRTE